MRRLLLPLTLAAVLAPAGHASAGWGADRVQTRSGEARAVHAAGGNGDRVALGWSRRLGGVTRAELRLGRARTGLTSSPSVLDASAANVEAPRPAYLRRGEFLAAWRRFRGGTERIRYLRVLADGRRSGTFEATTTGQDAFEPTWTAGPVLSWSRETRADAIDFAPSTGPRGLRLPAAPRSEPGIAAGAATVAWVHEGELLVSDRGDAGFGPPFVLATGAVSRPRVARVRGTTFVFWRSGQDLLVAHRPTDAAPFAPPRLALADTTDIAQVTPTSTGEVLMVAPVGDSSLVGALTLVRFGVGGARLGEPAVLGRGRRARLVADGTGAAFVAWLGERSTRDVRARRIAGGGILGSTRLLAARSDLASVPTLAATREGGAVAAWIAGGAVHARTYVP